jgi:ABC-type sulfate transport system permease component
MYVKLVRLVDLIIVVPIAVPMDHAPLLLATVMEIAQHLVVMEDFQIVQVKDV